MDREGTMEAVAMQLDSMEHVITAEKPSADALPEVVITFNAVAGCWVVKARYPEKNRHSAPDGLVQELIQSKSELANARAELDRMKNQSQTSKNDAVVTELIKTKGDLAPITGSDKRKGEHRARWANSALH